MSVKCLVTDTVYDRNGNPAVLQDFKFVPLSTIVGYQGDTYIPDTAVVTTDGSGDLSVYLVPGRYRIYTNAIDVRGQEVAVDAIGTVPEETTAILGVDVLGQQSPITPSVLLEAQNAASAAALSAAEAAASAELADSEGNATIAVAARDAAVVAQAAAETASDKAQEWAENPENVEVETGQFSALHHAINAEAAKAAAELAETNIGTSISDEATAIRTLTNKTISMGDNTLLDEYGNPFQRPLDFDNVADMIADARLMPGMSASTFGHFSVGDGGGARYRVVASTSDAASFYQTLDNGNIAVLADSTVHPLQVGYNVNVADMTTPAIVDANWVIMKSLIADVKSSTVYRLPTFHNTLTPQAVHAEWISGRTCPVGFYSDSTTDGATTTSHTSSTGSDSPFAVSVTESPNAYPAVFENFVDKVTNLTTSARCYNGGFDSQSFANGFGLKHWYNTWFRGTDGSNLDWSDVKMIVIAFGTTDSINLDDTGGVIDAYEADLEAVMLDCYLRGVQPALQGPVRTWQGGGTTLSYRDADESVTIIEAVQKRLSQKYGCPQFFMSEPVQSAIDNWESNTLRSGISSDGVHPNDEGHRLHAGYLLAQFNDNIPKLTSDKRTIHLPPGHPAFVMGDATDKLFPASVGGDVLQQVQQAYASNDAYIYEWLDAEGNGKTASEELVRMAIWVEKPSILIQTTIENDRTTKAITLESMTLFDTASDAGNPFEEQQQPVTEYYSHRQMLAFLHHGINIAYVYASTDGPDQKLGGFEVHDLDAFGGITLSRGTGGASYLTRFNTYAPSFGSYTWKSDRRSRRGPADYYNAGDNIFSYISFDLVADLDVGTTYSIYTHKNDIEDFNDGHNIMEILGDVVTLKTVTPSGTTTVDTATVSGLNAKLIAGAHVALRFRPRFASSLGLQCGLMINGTVEYNHTSAIGDQWTDGYGFEAPAILFRNAETVTQSPIRALMDLDRLV